MTTALAPKKKKAKKQNFYKGNPNVKRDGVQHMFTTWEVEEYAKCMVSVEYFAINYVKIIHLDRGLVSFDLYDYQKGLFNHFNDNRFSVVLACRQSGKSITAVIWLLWYAIFHAEKLIYILANKGSTAREILGRVTLALENLPFFLQPGCRSLNKGSMEFSNNSRIVAASTSASSIRGSSANVILLDEFAFVEKATAFYTSTYPVISSGNTSKVIITSTANGVGNLYYKIWEGALQGTNEYKPFRIDWWDVPGRDEAWKLQTIANTSELQFEVEYGNSFIGTSSTLIKGETLLGLRASAPVHYQDNVLIYEKPIEAHSYLMFVDVAKGRGQDYSTFNVIDITEKPFKQVAVYRDNLISPLLYPDIIYKFANSYNQAYVVIENNDCGAQVCSGLFYDLEYENVFIESYVKSDAVGINMTKKVKRIGCSQIKDIIEEGSLDIKDAETIIELSTFVHKGNSYEASEDNHDDLVMNLVLFGYFSSLTTFKDITDKSLKHILYNEQMKRIEEDVIPFGYIIDKDNDREVEVIGGDIWETDPTWGTF